MLSKGKISYHMGSQTSEKMRLLKTAKLRVVCERTESISTKEKGKSHLEVSCSHTLFSHKDFLVSPFRTHTLQPWRVSDLIFAKPALVGLFWLLVVLYITTIDQVFRTNILFFDCICLSFKMCRDVTVR